MAVDMTAEREVVFDTETTGLNAHDGDRIIELGAIELIDRIPTGNHFHSFFDPGPEFQQLDEKVTEITGYRIEDVRGKPAFAERAEEFLAFVGDSPLVAHNAEFDQRFINAELRRTGRDPFPGSRFIDTLKIARAAFPGSPATLDALCRRFGVSLGARDTHGALIDSELLAEVYLELRGGRARRLGLDAGGVASSAGPVTYAARPRPEPLPELPDDEFAAHAAFMEGETPEMIWERIWAREAARAG